MASLLLLVSGAASAKPKLVGYTVLGGAGVADVAKGSRATYLATDAGDELKLPSATLVLISTFDKVTILGCLDKCTPTQPKFVALVNDDLYETEILVAGSGARFGYPLHGAEGYSVVAETSVKRVVPGKYGDKVISLADGTAFRVSTLLLDPLFGTDVLVFARTVEIEDKKGKKKSVTLVKIFIAGEDLYDVIP